MEGAGCTGSPGRPRSPCPGRPWSRRPPLRRRVRRDGGSARTACWRNFCRSSSAGGLEGEIIQIRWRVNWYSQQTKGEVSMIMTWSQIEYVARLSYVCLLLIIPLPQTLTHLRYHSVISLQCMVTSTSLPYRLTSGEEESWNFRSSAATTPTMTTTICRLGAELRSDFGLFENEFEVLW